MAGLFDSLTVRGLRFPNRVAVSPMCQYSSQDGYASDWHLVHLGSRAVGRAGLVLAEASAVTPEGRITPGDLGLWKDEHIEMLARITAFIRSQGVPSGIQLAHAGRKASAAIPWKGGQGLPEAEGGWTPVAPSALRFSPGLKVPAALDLAGIQGVIAAFQAAAARALRAGFDVVEIHAAHGYLLHEFLSPLSNQRQDQYGGSFDNRCRLVKEVVTAVRKVWPEGKPLFIRLSATDWAEQGGWDLPQSVRLASELKGLGVDLVDCSSGGMLPDAKVPWGSGFQTIFAETVRRETGIMTGAVGFINSPHQADHIVRTGQADLVLLAREFLRNPYFPLSAAAALKHDQDWPVQYRGAKG